MSIGAKQLGALVIAIVVAVSSIGLSAAAFGDDGIVKNAFDEQFTVLSEATVESGGGGGTGGSTGGGGETPQDETITNLTGYTWVGNDYSMGGREYFRLDFVLKEYPQVRFTSLEDGKGAPSDGCLWYDGTKVYDFRTGWENPVYQTIIITGGLDTQYDKAIEWFQNNGTLTKTIS